MSLKVVTINYFFSQIYKVVYVMVFSFTWLDEPSQGLNFKRLLT